MPISNPATCLIESYEIIHITSKKTNMQYSLEEIDDTLVLKVGSIPVIGEDTI